MDALALQAMTETKLWLRRKETVFFSLLLPVMFLGFFGALYGRQTAAGTHVISYLVPGFAVFATMAVALGTVCTTLANERHEHILKRLAGTPLPRASAIGAKIIAGSALIGAVIAVLVLVGTLAYGAQIRGSVLAGILILIVGILSFAGMGILLGGTVKPDAAVAVANLVYLAFSFLGGVFVSLNQFPAGLRDVATLLPSERMVDALQLVWTKGDGIGSTGLDLPVVIAWGLASLLLSTRLFRWE